MPVHRGPLVAISRVTRLALLACAILALPALALAQGNADTPLAGAYTVTIAGEDIPPGLANGPALTGRWTLALDDGGDFSLARNDVGEVITGTFEAGPARLSFREWGGLFSCGEGGDDAEPATYAWRLNDDRLTLTPITDACPERLALLSTHAFGSIAACDAAPLAADPFAIAERAGTPAAGAAPGRGITAQEGYGEGAEVEESIDALLGQAGGCWATADVERFMALHSQGVLGQIGMMGPPEPFTRELQSFMEMPLGFARIGEVHLDDPSHAWAYVEVNLDGQPNPQRMTFVLEQGAWRLDTFFLFGPPLPGGPIGPGA